MQFLKECILNDVKLVRSAIRPLYYRFMRHQYYELTPIRVKMLSHRYIDKESMVKKEGNWKWVFHVREEQRRRTYGRFWKVKEEGKQQGNQ